ncbi:MAG: TetR/AcrR family transcriptional regulator [Desulfovibrionaceae bacterium]|jgi:AcrR family transcriptional regulator|nr:TetR/AcrR family transcriptional regulator [Desulfovibrionaceae bacterium]
MQRRKIIPLTDRADTRRRIVRAVGPTLARHGFEGFSAERVAEQAGLRSGLVRRHFDTLRDLVAEYGETPDFWPPVEELLGNTETLATLPPARQMAECFRNYLEAIRKRPTTQAIMTWEARERNHLSQALEMVRERTSLELFEHIKGEFPEDVDLSAVVMLLGGALHFIAMRAGSSSSFGGVDFHSEQGWQRMKDTLYELVIRTLGTGCPKARGDSAATTTAPAEPAATPDAPDTPDATDNRPRQGS